MSTIYCCGCAKKVHARLTDGREIYSHRRDLWPLPFWICDACGNFVGCHHKTNDRTRPLGCIPTPEIRELRKEIHKVLDALWNGDRAERRRIYGVISKRIGRQYHTAETRSVAEAREVLFILRGR